MQLSEEDIKILRLEEEILALNKVKNKIPSGNVNAEERIHEKTKKLLIEQVRY